MPSERPTREQLIALAKSDPEAIADLVLKLWDRVEALEARVRELERNPTRLPTAIAIAPLRRIAAASPRRPSRRVCGTSRDASPAGRTVMSVRPCFSPRTRTARSNTVSVRMRAAPTAGRSSAKVPGHFMRRIASAARSSSFPLSASRSSSIERSAAPVRTVERQSPPVFRSA